MINTSSAYFVSMVYVPTHQDLKDAADRIKGKVLRTPFIYSDALTRFIGQDVYLKPECLQPGGSFKFRGANNAVAMLTEEERQKGVVAASSGNYGTALALAASRAGIKATIVLPNNSNTAPPCKAARIEKAGATIVRHGNHYGDSEVLANQLAEEKGLVLIHPFDDPRVVAGQGTIGLEIDEDAPEDLASVLVPIGGGGLISGITLGMKFTRPDVLVIGVESYVAPSLTEALKAGKPVPIEPLPTCADGLSPRFTGDISFEVASERIEQIALLTEEELMAGSKFCLEELKLVVEPSGAAGVGALIAGKVELPPGPLAVVLSGSNLDVKFIKKIIE